MPHVYQFTPFITSEPVIIWQGCHGDTDDARDIGFLSMTLGEPVYAVEGGTVVDIFTTNCVSRIISPIEAIKVACPRANSITVRSSDGYYTRYSHVRPRNGLTMGSMVGERDLLGYVDNSGETDGPHVHLEGYSPNGQNHIPCDWEMNGLIPSDTNGWFQYNGNVYYFVDGIPQTGGFQLYVAPYWLELDSTTGAWTSVVWNERTGRCSRWENGRLVPTTCPF